MKTRAPLIAGILTTGLILFAGSASAVSISVFAPSSYSSNTVAMDAALGISGLTFEDFEDINLLPGLTVSWDGGTAVNTLAATYQGAPFGPWDGSKVLLNDSDNVSSGPDFSQTVSFSMQPDVTVFGVGLTQFETRRNPIVTVKAGTSTIIADLHADPNFIDALTSGPPYRNAYLLITAGAGESIDSVTFDLGQTRSGWSDDAVSFDHIALKYVEIPEPSSMLLLGFGLAGLGFSSCKRRG